MPNHENINKAPEKKSKAEMVVNEQVLASLMDVPFDNLRETMGIGDPQDPKIKKLNRAAALEFDKFVTELQTELNQPDPRIPPKNLARIKQTVLTALSKLEIKAAREMGPAALEDLMLAKQMKLEKQRKRI